MPSTSAQKIRFGLFELDLQSGELFKLGHKLNLRGQPVEVLSILLERAGEVVTREELCKRLWPEDTFVDFEHSLNTAVKKLRQALDDDVETPRYIETLPKKGYRFVGQVESAANRAGAAAEAGRAEPDAQPDSTQQAGNLPGLKPLANSDARAARLKSCPDTKPPQLGQPMVRTGKAQRWRYVVAVALILGAAAGALYWLVRPRVPVVTGIHQLTHTGQQKGTRYNSPVVTDGTRLYFRESNHGKVRIAQMSTKGGDISALEMPAIPDPWVGDISVDGSDLLVAETKLEGVDGWVWIASLPNGPQRRVDELLVNAAAFVPGSNQLLYAEAAQPKQVFRADLDGNHARRAFSVPEDVHDMIVSPDRKLVRFEVAGGRMWECGLDGSGMRRFFAEHGRPLHVGKWNADGRTYAFVSEDAETRNLWAAAEPGRLHRTGASKLVQLTNGPISFSVPTFSRDGKQMFANGEIRRGELAIYEPASHEFIPYLDGMSAGFFDYSSDGQWVAYVTYPQNVLWRSRVDGTERMQLTFPPMGPILLPKWSPDGKLIVFTEFYSGHQEQNKIEVVSANGGSPMLLVSGDFMPADPNWSPDGKSIVYGGASIAGGGGTEIRVLSLETKRSTTVPDSQHKFGPKLSPDGRYIAASSEDTAQLFLYSFDSKTWKQLPGTGLGWPMWSRDGRYLYAIQGHDGQGGQIYRYRVPDERKEVVADVTGIELACPAFGPRCTWFGLTPDERVLVLRDRGTEEVYALDVEYR